MKVSNSKSYDNLSKFFKRKKFDKSGALSSLLIEICLSSKNTMGFNQIKEEMLKTKGIIPSKSYKTYSEWRTVMTRNGILQCMATAQEIKDQDVNHKAGLFKIGFAIRKYIESALSEQMSIYERLDKKADNEFVLKQLDKKADNERVDEIEAKLTKEMAEIRAQLEDLLLYVKPPDNEKRRKIIRDNQNNKEECIRLLEIDSDSK